jgi:hypothetical protein
VSLSYDQIVKALRLADRLGDCVPDNIEETAKQIVDLQDQRRQYHLLIQVDGKTFDPGGPNDG